MNFIDQFKKDYPKFRLQKINIVVGNITEDLVDFCKGMISLDKDIRMMNLGNRNEQDIVNGIHYSKFKEEWKFYINPYHLLVKVKKDDKYIFWTHSREFIEAFFKLNSECKEVQLIRIDSIEDSIYFEFFNYQQMKRFVDNGYELRGIYRE